MERAPSLRVRRGSYSEQVIRRNYSVQDQFNPPNLFEDVQLSGVTVRNGNANQGTARKQIRGLNWS